MGSMEVGRQVPSLGLSIADSRAVITHPGLCVGGVGSHVELTEDLQHLTRADQFQNRRSALPACGVSALRGTPSNIALAYFIVFSITEQ